MRILAIQNDPIEPLGLIENYLKEHNYIWDTVATYGSYNTKTINTGKYDAMIVMGGRYDSWDEIYTPLHSLIKKFVDEGKGYLGVCLGAQLLAIAMGGKVELGKHPEVGHLEVQRTDMSKDEMILDGFNSSIHVFQWHQDCITSLPKNATNLLSSNIAQNQLIKINDKAYGMQFHWDIEDLILSELSAEHEKWLIEKRVNPQNLVSEMKNKGQIYKDNLYLLLDNWFKLLKI